MDGHQGGTTLAGDMVVCIDQSGGKSYLRAVSIQKTTYVSRIFPEKISPGSSGSSCYRCVISLGQSGADILFLFFTVFADAYVAVFFLCYFKLALSVSFIP